MVLAIVLPPLITISVFMLLISGLKDSVRNKD